MTDLLPTLAAAAGEPDVVDKLKNGATYGGRNYKLHLDGYDQTALFSGKSTASSRSFVFYYDETVLTAIRYKQFKITFSTKFNGKWDGALENLGRPQITNLLMDPFERQWGDLNRQYAEHKAWVLISHRRDRRAASGDVPGVPGAPGRPQRADGQDPRGHPVANPEDAESGLAILWPLQLLEVPGRSFT